MQKKLIKNSLLCIFGGLRRNPFRMAPEVGEVANRLVKSVIDVARNACIMRPLAAQADEKLQQGSNGQRVVRQLFKNWTTDRCGFLIYSDLRKRMEEG